MEIVKANIETFDIVKNITQTTISEVYPKYYPYGAVEFFTNHHSDDNIMEDINSGIVYLLRDNGEFVGTVTIKDNDINRLFVLPIYQHKGYGKFLLDFAESELFKTYEEIYLSASLPAKKIYQIRGYVEIEYNQIETPNGDFLCYDLMKKNKPE